MQEWYLMTSNTRPNLTGGFENEVYVNYKDDAFAESLETDITTTITLYNSDLSKSLIVRCIVQNNVTDSQEKSVERQCLFQIGVLENYTYVFFENQYWLIKSYVGNNGLFEKAIVELCTYSIKFQHPTTGTILSYPCIDDASSSIGLDANNTITTLNGIHHIKIPYDDNTKLINYESRFFLDRVGTTTYKTTNINNTSYSYGDKGLIELTLQQDSAYNPLTDKNGVCDYKEPTVTPTPPDPTVPTEIVTITSDVEDNNIKLGLVYTFSATFKNELGQTVTDAVGQYSINNTYGGKVVLTDNGDGTCTVKVGEFADSDLCTKQFTLTCTDTQHGFASSIVLTIVGLF